jgi:hypothetical protein
MKQAGQNERSLLLILFALLVLFIATSFGTSFIRERGVFENHTPVVDLLQR